MFEEPFMMMMMSYCFRSASRPEKRKRKKLMLSAMLRRFAREKKEMRKLNSSNSSQLLQTDTLLGDLTSDPAMMSLLTSASERELQDLLNDLDFQAMDTAHQTQRMENSPMCMGGGPRAVGKACMNRGAGIISPPPLPEGLPAPLVKRIEDLRAVRVTLGSSSATALILFHIIMFYLFICLLI